MKYSNGKLNIRGKVVIIILAIAFVISVVSVGISYYVYSAKMDERYEKMSIDFTDTSIVCLENVNLKSVCSDVLSTYKKQMDKLGYVPYDEDLSDEDAEEYYAAYSVAENGSTYQHILKVLRTLVDVNDVESLYICVYDLENQTAIFVVDGSDPDTTGQTPIGYVDTIDSENLMELENKTYDFKPYVSKSKYGWLSTATQSILDDDGNLICNIYADINMNDVREDRIQYLNRLAVILLLITIILILLALNMVNRTIVIPINILSKAADNYSHEEKEAHEMVFEKLDIHTGDELEGLKDSFSKMEHEIQDYLDNLTIITAEREKTAAELNVAAGIQASYLPREMPAFPDRDEFELFASMNPAKEVGGDFYDYYMIDDDHLVLTIADVSGKGIPAAMFMMESMTMLKAYAKAGESLSPAEILAAVNNQLCERNEVEMFVTVWLAIVTISTGHVVAASAGHEYPCIQKAGENFELLKDRHGFVLAGMEDSRYKDYEIELSRGDCIFVYTDGVAEATNAENELFGTDRLIDALNVQPSAEMDVLLNNMQNAIDDFVKEAPQFDDITMVAFRYFGPKEK